MATPTQTAAMARPGDRLRQARAAQAAAPLLQPQPQAAPPFAPPPGMAPVAAAQPFAQIQPQRMAVPAGEVAGLPAAAPAGHPMAHVKDSAAWRRSVEGALDSALPAGLKFVDRVSNAISGPILMDDREPQKPTDPNMVDLDSWHAPLNKSVYRPARMGLMILVFFLGGFLFWANTAPLASAVVSSGLFVATGQNRIVQHLEGGIIRSIKVKEGQAVEVGQELLVLDSTTVGADVRRLELRQATLLATKARLDAERALSEKITYPSELIELQTDTEIAKVIGSQNALFSSRREEFETQRQINESQIVAIQEEVMGLKSQMIAAREQLKLVKEEQAGAQRLYSRGLTELNRLLNVKRNRAKLEGDVGQIQSAISKAEQRILETRTELASMRSRIVAEGADLYRETTAELSDTEERLNASRGVLNRQVIVAPVKGKVVKLEFHTIGGVIGPGQPVLELLPTDEQLIVEAAVAPHDIPHVREGLDAELRLSALNQRTTPMVMGKVVYVSPDKVQGDPRQPGSYHYVARIALDEKSIRNDLPKDTKISPGMPAEVYIKTGERTMMQYLLQPLFDSLSRAGRESN